MTDAQIDSSMQQALAMRDRSRTLRRQIQELAASVAAGGHHLDVAPALKHLDELENEVDAAQPVSIALLGGTGSGKSTLLNALLGARLVPTSSMRACTSVITKARWSEGPGYRATVYFVPRDSWLRQVEFAASDVAAAKQPDDEEQSTRQAAVSKDEQDRLRAVYGADQTADFLASGDSSVLELPATIAEAFSSGRHDVISGDLDDFRSSIKGYLDSSEHYWPIVKTVEIEGPFSVLSGGGELVDLPGLNDPNEAREATTREYLESARFVWVVFNMKRNLTKDLTDTLRSRDLLGRLLAGGRLATITLVGTASDDIDPESDCEALGLHEDSSADEIVRARNERSAEIAAEQLRELAADLAAAGEPSAESSLIAEALTRSPFFAVSARDFLAHSGLTKSPIRINDPVLTQIPLLRQHFSSTATEAGPWAQAVRSYGYLEAAVAEVNRAIHQQRAQYELATTTEVADRERVAAGVEATSARLEDEASQVLTHLGRSLQAASERFAAKLNGGIDESVRALRSVTSGWVGIHWMTLRAISVRGGAYVSPTFGPIDLIQQVADPLLGKATAPWIEFFGDDMTSILDDTNSGLTNTLVGYSSGVESLVVSRHQQNDLLLEKLTRLVDDVTTSVETSLSVLKGSLSDNVAKERQMLHRVTLERVRSALAGAFAEAAGQRGTGMKRRILDILERAVQESARSEYEAIASVLHEQTTVTGADVYAELEEAVDGIVGKAKSVSDGIRRSALEPVPSDDRWIRETEAAVAALGPLALKPLIPPVFLTRLSSLSATEPTLPRADGGNLPVVAGGALPAPAAPVASGLVIIDGANVAASPGKGPDIARLEDCINAAVANWPDKKVVTVADRKLRSFLVRQDEVDQVEGLDKLIARGAVIEPPPGHPGKADSFILLQARDRNAIVLSNDSFKEFQHQNPWLAAGDRLFGYTYHAELGWTFTSRFAVKARQ